MAQQGEQVYRHPHAPLESRVKDLISRMTLKEKIGQMTLVERRVLTLADLREGRFGGLMSAVGKGPFPNATFSDWADMIDEYQQANLESWLGIPLIYGIDAIHGNNNVCGATIFPHNIGLGATRDAELIQRIGAVTALEMRASGLHYAFAPCVAVVRDTRWTRCYESYSEDTNVVRKMTSVITGLQGKPPPDYPSGYPFVAGRNNVIACAKHFVGDGGTEGGINEGNTVASYEDLEKIHMAPYLDSIPRNVSTIMASYSSWNGQKMHSNMFLLTEILKSKLGFKGMVISDWSPIDHLGVPRGTSYRHCTALAINAGIDMVMVPYEFDKFQESLLSLVEAGEVPISRIDDAVERILRLKFVSGIFEHPFSDRSLIDQAGCALHREIAREAVKKSLVLLKNGKDPNKPFLPLEKNAKKILVAGSHADDLGLQCGAWTIRWTGLRGRSTIGTTILDAVKGAVGAETEVVYEQQPSKETLSAHDFCFAIVAVGEDCYAENMETNQELVIQFDGGNVIRSVVEKVPTLVILISGRPIIIEPDILDKVDALAAAWLPGTEGDGITDVVFGDHGFVGRLPVSWFRSVDQLPLDPSSSSSNSYDPLFPVGFGLTCEKKDMSVDMARHGTCVSLIRL